MKRYFVVFLILIGCWIMFTGATSPDELVVGVGASIAVTFMSARFTCPRKEELKVLQGVVAFIRYSVRLVLEEIKAHARMTLIILRGEEKESFIKIKRPTHHELVNLLVYNGITLTPGTIVVRSDDDSAIVHVASPELK